MRNNYANKNNKGNNKVKKDKPTLATTRVSKKKIDKPSADLDNCERIITLVNGILEAAAKVYASFPAGEYHLNKEQTSAMNALNDAVFELERENDEYKDCIRKYEDKYIKYQLNELVSRGIITEKQAAESLQQRGIDTND